MHNLSPDLPHFCFSIGAFAQNSTNVTYVSVSKKEKKRTYKCLGKLHNQNFEIRKCQHYCLHVIIMKKCVGWMNVYCYKHRIPGSHIKDDLWSSDDHIVNMYWFITSKPSAAWITDFMLFHVIFRAWKQNCYLLLVLMEYLSYKHNLNHFGRVEALMLSFNR